MPVPLYLSKKKSELCKRTKVFEIFKSSVIFVFTWSKVSGIEKSQNLLGSTLCELFTWFESFLPQSDVLRSQVVLVCNLLSTSGSSFSELALDPSGLFFLKTIQDFITREPETTNIISCILSASDGVQVLWCVHQGAQTWKSQLSQNAPLLFFLWITWRRWNWRWCSRKRCSSEEKSKQKIISQLRAWRLVDICTGNANIDKKKPGRSTQWEIDSQRVLGIRVMVLRYARVCSNMSVRFTS